MDERFERVVNCFDAVRLQTKFKPTAAIVLGSGLGDFVEQVDIECAIDYVDIPTFPRSTVSGHHGKLIFGKIADVSCVIMQGRVHYYEGYSLEDVVLPIRMMRLLGARTLFLTNAAGAINEEYAPGDFMLISDHIASFMPSLLAGPNINEFGSRFPDMTNVYDAKLRKVIQEIAALQNVRLHEGVYLQVPGPAYETPAEIRAYRTLGADAVGMSTAVEAMAASHMGMRVCGLSFLSNMAAGMSGRPLSHEEVRSAADAASPRFKKLLAGIVTVAGGE